MEIIKRLRINTLKINKIIQKTNNVNKSDKMQT